MTINVFQLTFISVKFHLYLFTSIRPLKFLRKILLILFPAVISTDNRVIHLLSYSP